MPNFESILSQEVQTAERPKAAPVGTYICNVKDHTFDSSSRKQTPYVRYGLTPMVAEDDVDPDALEEYGGLEGKSLRIDFYLTPDAVYRLREFLEEHLHINCDGRTFAETIPEAVGQQVKVHVTHTISDDGKQTYANIDSTAPVD